MPGCQPKESLPGVFVSWVVEVQIAVLQNSPMGTSLQYAVEVAQAFVRLHESIPNKVLLQRRNGHFLTITQGPQLHRQAYKYQVGQQEKNIPSEAKAQSLSPGFGETWGREPADDFGTNSDIKWKWSCPTSVEIFST